MGNDRHALTRNQCGMTTNVESSLRSLENQFNKYSSHRFGSQTIWCCIYRLHIKSYIASTVVRYVLCGWFGSTIQIHRTITASRHDCDMISVVESVILVNINIPTDLGMSNH